MTIVSSAATAAAHAATVAAWAKSEALNLPLSFERQRAASSADLRDIIETIGGLAAAVETIGRAADHFRPPNPEMGTYVTGFGQLSVGGEPVPIDWPTDLMRLYRDLAAAALLAVTAAGASEATDDVPTIAMPVPLFDLLVAVAGAVEKADPYAGVAPSLFELRARHLATVKD